MLIVFDLDGTLEDSREDMAASVARVRIKLGLPAKAKEAIVPHLSKGMDHLYTHCFNELREDSDTMAVAKQQYIEDYGQNIAKTTRLYPGIRAAIETLSQRASLAVVTNKPEALSRLLLEALGMASYFKSVVGGDSCTESKPSPIPLLFAAQQCGAENNLASVVMVGDSGGDIAMAKAAGIKSIWCAWGYASTPGELAADATATTPDRLAETVSALFKRP